MVRQSGQTLKIMMIECFASRISSRFEGQIKVSETDGGADRNIAKISTQK
jgi:hypothetical protein